jgi:hypothetical protein
VSVIARKKDVAVGSGHTAEYAVRLLGISGLTNDMRELQAELKERRPPGAAGG